MQKGGIFCYAIKKTATQQPQERGPICHAIKPRVAQPPQIDAGLFAIPKTGKALHKSAAPDRMHSRRSIRHAVSAERFATNSTTAGQTTQEQTRRSDSMQRKTPAKKAHKNGLY